MKNYIIVLMLFLGLMAFGCVSSPPMPGSDKDVHGCISSAGYVWCDAKQKCLRVWEENCTETKADTAPITTPTTNTTPALTVEEQAKKFCGTENVQEVTICGNTIRVIGSLPGAGSTFYRNGEAIQECPVVAPNTVSEQCKALFKGDKCFETKIC